MRAVKTSNYVGLKDKKGEIELDKVEPLIKDISNDLLTLFTVLQRRVRFGNGTANNSENIDGEFILYTSNGVADTEDTIAHTLGSVPIGYLIMKQDKAGSVYEGGTAWTSTNLYLKQTGTSVATTLFLLK